MRKNLNKIVAFAIGVSVISGLAIPVMADTKVTYANSDSTNQNNTKQVLTLEDAIKNAIANSDTLNLYDKKINYQNQINNANETLDKYKDLDSDTDDYNDDLRELTLNQLKQKKEFEEDKLIKRVTDSYNNLVSSQIQIDNLEKKVEIQNKKFNDTKLMNTLGLTTSLDTQEFDISIQTLNNNIKSLKNNLQNDEDSFKTLTSMDLNNYSLDQNIKYDVFRIDGSIDEYVDGVLETYLTYNEQIIKLNKDYLDDNKVDEPDKFTGEKPQKNQFTSDPEGTENGQTADQKYDKALADYESELDLYSKKMNGRITYLQSKLSLFENENILNENKKNFKDTLKSYYSLLLSKENDINLLQEKIDLSNKKLRIAKLQYDLGTSTKTDYDKSILDSSNLNLELIQAIISYNQTKEKIEKPWIGLS